MLTAIMFKARARRERQGSKTRRQRGNTLVLAMIVLSALATLGSLTIVSVQGSYKASTHDRSQMIAMLAAESGAAVAIEWLRTRYDVTTANPSPVTVCLTVPPPGPPTVPPATVNATATHWGAFVTANSSTPFTLARPAAPTPMVLLQNNVPPEMTSNAAPPLASDNVFSPDQNASYDVEILNNVDDPGFAQAPPNGDIDGRVIVHSTGHGPQGSLAILEIEVQMYDCPCGPTTIPGFPGAQTFPAAPPPPPNTAPTPLPGMIIVGWRVVL